MAEKKTKKEDVTEDVTGEVYESSTDRHNHRNYTGGLILLVLGIIFLLSEFIPSIDVGKLWPLILIAIGLGILLKSPKS